MQVRKIFAACVVGFASFAAVAADDDNIGRVTPAHKCIPLAVEPFGAEHFSEWPARFERCQQARETAETERERLYATLWAAKLAYLVRRFEASRELMADIRSQIAANPEAGTGDIAFELEFLEILHIARRDELEKAFPRAKAFSDAHPTALSAHRLYAELALESERYAEMTEAYQRQIRLSSSTRIEKQMVFVLRKREEYAALRDYLITELDINRQTYNEANTLLRLVAAYYSHGDQEATGTLIAALEGEGLDHANHAWQHTVFAAFPSLAIKAIGARLGFRDREELKELKAKHLVATGQEQAALALMADTKLRCNDRECQNLEIALAQARGDEAEVSRLVARRDNSTFSVKRLGRQWDNNLLSHLPSRPVEALHRDTRAVFETTTHELADGEYRIRAETGTPVTHQEVADATLEAARQFAAKAGANGFVVTQYDVGHSYEKSKIAGLDYKKLVAQRGTMNILLVEGKTPLDSIGLVPWRVNPAP